MAWIRGLTLCACILYAYGYLAGEGDTLESLGSVEPLLHPDDFDQNIKQPINPILTDTVQEKNILGRPDGHDNVDKHIIGGNDGHDQPIIGGKDGHDKAIIGGNDGHDQPILGGKDGHDHPIIGENDGHDKSIIGGEESHERSDTNKQKKDESADSSSEESSHEYMSHDDYYDGDDEITDERMTEIYGDDYDDEDYDDGNRPLVRCPRPLCGELYCEDGYQTDDRACPVCACLEDPCKTMECRVGEICQVHDCTDEKNCKKLTAECIEDTPSCAMPMCANYCEHGYHYDERGCMSCECEPAPSAAPLTATSTSAPPQDDQWDCPQIDCVVHCDSGYIIDEHGCTTCSCKQPGDWTTTKLSCAEPMCANKCERGYMRNEYGCMTCECATSDKACGVERCEQDEKCAPVYHDPQEIGPRRCVPKTLCETQRDEVSKVSGGSTSQCDEQTGKFRPLQCNRLQSECWCVDDRGVVIENTRTSVYVDEHKPHCRSNITVAVTIHMLLTMTRARQSSYDGQYSVTELISRDLPIGLSYCTLINRDFVSVNKVEEITGLDEIPGGAGSSYVGSQYFVEVMVRHDQLVDLPAAMQRLKYRAQFGRCKIAIEDGGELEPQPDTLNIEHRFSLLPSFSLLSNQPTITDPVTGPYTDEGSWYDSKNVYIMMFIILLSVLVVVCSVLAITHVVRRRRRMGQMNFQHQRLESQISTYSEKSLLGGRDDKVLLINNGPTEEKMTMRA